jgi:hypothetical protein
VSCPVFARLISIDFLDPSKTALLGVIRRFPCAFRFEVDNSANRNKIEGKIKKSFNLQICKHLPEQYGLIIDIELIFNYSQLVKFKGYGI